ncbi:MAG: anti-sigma factor [Alphaproteobacteria bacterium]|nr:anti-sigma factor [Alphaproteobacteria bacterium]
MTTTNDNIQPLETIDERDLHAYVDGLLDEHRARKVEDYLKRHPDKAAEVQDYIAYNKLLRKAYEQEADEPVPQRLLSILNRPVRNIWPAVGQVAAVVVLCALSAGGGWLGAYQSGGAVSKEDGMVRSFLHQVALNAEQPFEAMPVQKLEINAETQTDPLNWLTQKLALEMQAPDLTQAGYTLERRRLVTRGPQEFVELKYTNSSGDAVRLYMKTRWEKEAPTIEFARKEGQSIAYWQEGPLVYALSGPLDRNRAAQIADLVRGSMTDVPNKPPHVQDVQIVAPQPVHPVQPVQQPQVNYGIQPVMPLAPQKMNAVGGQY